MRRREMIAGLAASAVAARSNAQQIEMMSPEEAIALEHSTRSQRLQRLVREHHIFPEPEFFTYEIPRNIMPPGARFDTPVLRVVFPESTFFDTGRSELLSSAYPIVLAMANTLQGDVPDVATFVAGHADNRGSEPYNYELSVARARAVATALRQAGAERADVWSVGFGESLPLYENSSSMNMAYNRRVEFMFAAHREAVANWLKDQMDVACSSSDSSARNRCLIALKVRPAYVVEAVPPALAQVKRPGQSRVTAATPQKAAVVEPKPRQIVINLAERSFVVSRPEL